MHNDDHRLFSARRLVLFEMGAFLVFICFIWVSELVDFPHRFLGAAPSPVNWRESLFETLMILPLALVVVSFTRKVIERMRYLEGLLRVCSHCRKVADEDGQWQELEGFIQKRSDARFTHGLCPTCAMKLYPEVFGKDRAGDGEKKAA